MALRVAVLGFLALGDLRVLFLRLWALQVLSGDRYLSVANDNRVRTVRLEAPRGPILDRNGHVLVGNVAGTRVELWPADLPKTWAPAATSCGASPSSPARRSRTCSTQLDEHGNDPLSPVVVQRGLKRDQIYYLSEHSAQFPGVQMHNSFLRSYRFQSLAAQVLGYVGPISAEQYKALKRKGSRRATRSARRASSRRTTRTSGGRTARPS